MVSLAVPLISPIQFVVDGKDLTLPENKVPEITVKAQVDVPPLDISEFAEAVREGNMTTKAALEAVELAQIKAAANTKTVIASMGKTFEAVVKEIKEVADKKAAPPVVVVPKLKRSVETQTAERNNMGEIKGTASETTYEYEDE